MTKKYVNPMLQIVSIKDNDILTTSTLNVNTGISVNNQFAPGQRGVFDPDDSWANAGY